MMFMFAQVTPTFALDDGAYLIGCSTSYVNPLTNETEDGGTNIALGDSMVSSIVEKQLLLEQVNGKIYITVGLGLSSQVSNVRFKTMNSSGKMSSVKATVTGSSSANGDTVTHYRIQVSSLSNYISPIMYVGAMGRDVQFFIKLNSGSISSGTGVYTSEMVKTTSPKQEETSKKETTKKETTSETKKEDNTTSQETKSEETTQQDNQNTETTQQNTVTVDKETLFKDVTGLSYHRVEQSSQTPVFLYVGIGVICVIALGGILYVKKIKK